jgi:hypothetical protein
MIPSKTFYPKLPLLSLVFATLIFCACATEKPHQISHDKLSRNIKLFNADFEARSAEVSAILVKSDTRENYLLQLPDIKEKITFSESSVIKIEYFKEGVFAKQSGGIPEEEFNECVVTMRYKLVILPSNKLTTKIAKQRWIKEGEDWVVIPDLAQFAN